MIFGAAKPWMLGLVGALGKAVGSARNKVAQLHAHGLTPTETELADHIVHLMSEYDPELKGRKILTSESRNHLALGIAGVLLSAMEADGALEPIPHRRENTA